MACARTFTVDELRDLQVWFNLAWFDPQTLASDPLVELVEREAATSARKTSRCWPQSRPTSWPAPSPPTSEAARRGQIELSTSPYFHPILPLLCNTDSARIAAPGHAPPPPRRFAHPEDAAEQITERLGQA